MLLLLPKFDSGRDLLYNLLKQNVMAKSENVIRGRIGNMIFYRVRGVTRIRSVPLSAVRPDALKCRNQISEVKVAPSPPPFKIYYTDREIRI